MKARLAISILLLSIHVTACSGGAPETASPQVKLGAAKVRAEKLDASAYLELGLELAEEGKHNQALDWFEQALELAPGDAQVTLARAQSFAALGQFSRAKVEYDRAVADLPESAEAFAGRAYVLDQLEFDEQALIDAIRAIELGSDDPFVYFLRASAYYDRGSFGLARQHLDTALELDPDYPAAYHLRSHVLLELGEYELSLQDLERAADLDPENPAILYDRGRALFWANRAGEAIDDFDRAHSLDPDAPEILAARGDAYFALGNYHSALDDFNAAIALEPEFAEAYTGRALALTMLGEFDRALRDADLAIELGAECPCAYFARAWIHYLGFHDLEKALADIDKAIELDPLNGVAYAMRGWIQLDLGNQELAIEDLRIALDLGLPPEVEGPVTATLMELGAIDLHAVEG